MPKKTIRAVVFIMLASLVLTTVLSGIAALF
ncbi:stressosome-associated protein Prli42 [Caenibacillus caldisaponilyticus]|jgi:hypothetical protein|nr:stressosome-associated protein Prli42 [Caenibacillus caldisaponilyticus]